METKFILAGKDLVGNNSNANLWLVRAVSNPYAAHGPGELTVNVKHSCHIDRRCTIQLYSMLFGLLGTARNAILPRPYRFKLECFESDENPILALIREHCPTISGTKSATASRWLASGHLQTVYTSLMNPSNTDQVRYKRKVMMVPDGGIVALDFGTYGSKTIVTYIRSTRIHG